MREKREKWLGAARLLGISLLLALLGFWVPLRHLNLTAGYDWDLFGAYSLVVRSIVLVYHRLPLHDPWVCGGLDLLANPQTRIFSPMVLLDLLFSPYVSDLVSLIVYGVAGILGMFFLVRERGGSRESSLVAAVLFIHSSWFGLHFVEGHIAFGSMQLLPWVLFFALRLGRNGAVFGLLSLLTLFVLDGGIYSAIFSLWLLIAGAAVGLIHPTAAFSGAGAGGRRRRAVGLLSALAALLLVSVKVVPVLLLTSGISPALDFTRLGAGDLLRVLFNPFQKSLAVATTTAVWRFHEFGCYLSPVGAGLILYGCARSREFFRRNNQLLLLAAFFFWIASGWGGDFNPWHLYQRIPLLNTAHVQSRLFVLMDLFFALGVAAALDLVGIRRGLRTLLLVLLVAEALFVKSYPLDFGFRYAKPRASLGVIPEVSIRGMRWMGDKPGLYLAGDYAYAHAYEAAAPRTGVVSEGEPGYRGLVYPIAGQGEVSLESYTPGRILIGYSARGPLEAVIDSNYLGGWRVESGDARVHPGPRGLIGLDLEAGSGKVLLAYEPAYLPYVLAAFGLGLALWLGLALSVARRPA